MLFIRNLQSFSVGKSPLIPYICILQYKMYTCVCDLGPNRWELTFLQRMIFIVTRSISKICDFPFTILFPHRLSKLFFMD